MKRHITPLIGTISFSLLILVLYSGCATTPTELLIPQEHKDAVSLSLDDAFDASWQAFTIYIEDSDYISAGLTNVGQCKAEVVDRRDMMAEYEDFPTVPAIAAVSVEKDLQGLVTVTIRYAPLPVKDARPETYGGVFQYVYGSHGGKLGLRSKTKSIH